MDEDLKTLLASLLAADPDAPLDDAGRERVIYAMLALQPREHIVALWTFASSIKNEFKRSHLLHKLVELTAKRAIEHDLAEQIAKSIPDAYWRFSALNKVAAELLKRASQYEEFSPEASSELRERGLSLLQEVEEGLVSIPEDDGDRATVLWSAGLSLVGAGKLEWAETLASTTKYCAENTEVLLRSAKARITLGQIVRAAEIVRIVIELASAGNDEPIKRAFDLKSASELLFDCGAFEDARKCLEQASELAITSQEADIDGCKCMVAIAVAFARQGHSEQARSAANKIPQLARREYALKKISELSAAV